MLEGLTGWQKRAWLDGDWDIAAGQFFTTFRRDVHVVEDFDDTRAVEWFAALDYGFAHYTVVLLGCRDGEPGRRIVGESNTKPSFRWARFHFHIPLSLPRNEF